MVVTFTLSAGCADLHLLDMLTPVERKRQGYIHELIVTEENYVNDLQLVTEVRSGTALWMMCRTCQKLRRYSMLVNLDIISSVHHFLPNFGH